MEEIIDTGFDSLNEILVEGYSGNNNELIIATAGNENNINEYLLRTINSYVNQDVPLAYVSYGEDDDVAAKFPMIYHFHSSVAFRELRLILRDLKRDAGIKLVVFNNMILLYPMQKYRGTLAGVLIAFSRQLRCLSLELGIPIIATAPHSALSLTFRGERIEQDADVIISLERDNNQLKPIVTKNRGGKCHLNFTEWLERQTYNCKNEG